MSDGYSQVISYQPAINAELLLDLRDNLPEFAKLRVELRCGEYRECLSIAISMFP